MVNEFSISCSGAWRKPQHAAADGTLIDTPCFEHPIFKEDFEVQGARGSSGCDASSLV